jgi:hypothetical protein
VQPRTRGFQFDGEERARLIGEVTLSLSFVARDAMRSLIQEASHGRADLNPPPDGQLMTPGPEHRRVSVKALASQWAGALFPLSLATCPFLRVAFLRRPPARDEGDWS